MKDITEHIFFNGALALAVAATLAVTLLTGCKTVSSTPPLTAAEAAGLGTAAYIHGYPLVTMEVTRRVMTNLREPEAMCAPMGQFDRARTYPTSETDADGKSHSGANKDILHFNKGKLPPVDGFWSLTI